MSRLRVRSNELARSGRRLSSGAADCTDARNYGISSPCGCSIPSDVWDNRFKSSAHFRTARPNIAGALSAALPALISVGGELVNTGIGVAGQVAGGAQAQRLAQQQAEIAALAGNIDLQKANAQNALYKTYAAYGALAFGFTGLLGVGAWMWSKS